MTDLAFAFDTIQRLVDSQTSKIAVLKRDMRRLAEICESAHAYVGAYREELRVSDTGLVGWYKMMTLLESGYKQYRSQLAEEATSGNV